MPQAKTRLCMRLLLFFFLPVFPLRVALSLESPAQDCPRPEEGTTVQEPPEISSKSGLLDLNLNFKTSLSSSGERRYCYVSDSGLLSPTLRLVPGDTLSIHFQNKLPP